MNFPCFAGCKCRKHFQISQAFLNLFFWKFLFVWFSFPASISMNAFAVAGAKVEPFSAFASFFTEFFQCFFDIFLNILITGALHFKLFWILVSFFSNTSIVLAFSARFRIPILWSFQTLSPFFEEIPCFQSPHLPFLIPQRHQDVKFSPLEVEILLLFSLKSKRLERIAGNSS